MKKAGYLLAVLAAFLVAPVFPGAAGAHVEMTPPEAKAGKPVDLSFEIPHGCDGAATTSLVVQIPSAAADATATAVKGWKAQTSPRTLTWTGGPLPDHETMDFPFRATLYGNKGDTVMFKVIQKCQGGAETAWIEAMKGDVEPEHPAPAVTLISSATAPAGSSDPVVAGHQDADAGAAGTSQPTATDADTASEDSSDDDNGGKKLLLIIIGGLAIGTVAGLVVRARRDKK